MLWSMLKICWLFVLCFALGFGNVASAGEGSRSLRCEWVRSTSSTTTKDGKLEVESADGGMDPIQLELDFGAETAMLAGNAGIVPLALFTGPKSVHLLETTDVGNLTLITIFYEATSKGMPAVWSRHIKIGDKHAASQFYGWCVPLDPMKKPAK